jgi:hypothetical protein
VTYPVTQGIPYSLLSPTVIKIENGKIRRIETIDKTAPYGVKSGWQSQRLVSAGVSSGILPARD